MDPLQLFIFVIALILVVLVARFVVGHLAPSLDAGLRNIVVIAILLAFALAWWQGGWGGYFLR